MRCDEMRRAAATVTTVAAAVDAVDADPTADGGGTAKGNVCQTQPCSPMAASQCGGVNGQRVQTRKMAREENIGDK